MGISNKTINVNKLRHGGLDEKFNNYINKSLFTLKIARSILRSCLKIQFSIILQLLVRIFQKRRVRQKIQSKTNIPRFKYFVEKLSIFFAFDFEFVFLIISYKF